MGLLSVPLKTVLMFHADVQSESIPESYAVCDGTVLNSSQQDINPGSTYTLPDLRNRFILGADIGKVAATAGGTTNSATDAPGPKGAGGVHSKTLAVGELPSHSHTGTIATAGAHTHAGSTAASNGDHTHTLTISSAGAHTHSGSSTSTTGAHTHAGSTATSSGAHTHTITDPGHIHSLVGNAAGGSGGTGPSAQSASFNPTNTINVTQSAVTGITIVSGGAHTHTLSLVSDGDHSHTLTIASDGGHTHSATVNNGGAHTHTLSITSDGAHTHTFTGDPAGSGTAFDTRPRYYGLVFIMKVKI